MSRFGLMNDIHHIIHPLQAQPAHGPLWVKRYTGHPATSPAMSAIGPKAEVNSEYWLLRHMPVRVDGTARDVIQAPKLEARIMRYELSDYEWTAIKQMLPNKPRGVRRVNDRRVLNGIFWVLRSGAPWRDLPESYGPRTTCYNRFVRWRQAGVWDQIMDALATGHDPAVHMIDTSLVRVHQHGACIANNNHQDMGRSRGGLTSKIHAVVDTNGLPVHLALTPGEAHDNRLCSVLLRALLPQTMLLADRGYDADWIRELARQQGAWANIPPKRNRKDPICFNPYLYRARNLVERFFNKIKQCRRVATRYDKLAANYLAFVKLASIRIWLRANESAP
jgi:transposase